MCVFWLQYDFPHTGPEKENCLFVEILKFSILLSVFKCDQYLVNFSFVSVWFYFEFFFFFGHLSTHLYLLCECKKTCIVMSNPMLRSLQPDCVFIVVLYL